MADEGVKPRKGAAGRSVIVILIVGILLLLAYRYYSAKPGSWLAGPAEYSLQYMPAEYKMDLDPELALAILQNPRRYRAEFDDMVYDINISILDHVSNRLGLNDSLHTEVIQEYTRQHPQLAELYFTDFMQVRDTSATVYDTWYEEGGKQITEVFEIVASNYTCFMVNKILSAVIRLHNGNILASGNDIDSPCGIAMGEALSPLMRKMEERAAIDDFSRSRGLFQEKIERFIGELATIEVRDKKGINKNLQTSIWGVNVSSTDVEITAISILKVGFRLTDFLDINMDPRNQLLTITLPEPSILSHEVLPKIERLDIGWMRELESVNINEGINSLRENFRAEAIESNIYDRAREQAQELMSTMFTPIVRTIGNNYRIKVEFRDVAPAATQELVQEES